MQAFISSFDFESAYAIANPPCPTAEWRPLSFDGPMIAARTEGGDPPDGGATILPVGGAPGSFGTAATVVVQYKRNKAMNECAENAALDDEHGNPLDPVVTDKILRRHAALFQPNRRITLDFASQPDGKFTADVLSDEPMGLENTFVGDRFLPVPLSSLRWTHRLLAGHPLYLVTRNDRNDCLVQVFKEAVDYAPVDVSFFAGLPPADILLPPTHVVLDDLGWFHGILLDYHPATSLKSVLGSGTTAGLPWTVKLVWACDIAAGIAFLHSKGVVWGDVKTSNVILCKDGHCRLINYCPEGSTAAWYRPETLECEWHPSSTDDNGALGLVLWSIAVDEAQLPWEREGSCDDGRHLEWKKEANVPVHFQQLVVSTRGLECPSAEAIHASLVAMLSAYK
ncbi:hypothetical protein DFH06DRAFT_1487370 [Mycena polygramma]|nr:hypothetical protein DFH06DRAFT_1487370 [Mycena polygramma]